ncbi:hypothetical protein IMSAGC019_02968 [Lachnospiraceae bacterium]|nr:hypothetical protein IMSAGC019_02968 [Lachnospiraceae bacterium]
MLHKILFFIHYDEKSYEDHFYAYLAEKDDLVKVFLADELQNFLEAVARRSGFQEGDLLDLYLAQDGQCREKYEFDALFLEAGMKLSEYSSWTDEEAFEAISQKVMGQKERVALHGRKKGIGTQKEFSMEAYCRYCAAQGENSKDSIAEPARQAKTGKPPLAELMRKVAEGR